MDQIRVLRATIFDQPLAELAEQGRQGREQKRGPSDPLAG
jgi:hypothetical protein